MARLENEYRYGMSKAQIESLYIGLDQPKIEFKFDDSNRPKETGTKLWLTSK